MKNKSETNAYLHLFIFVTSLAIPIALYFNRYLDDNRLTSWKWVFEYTDPTRPFFVLFGVLVLAWLLSQVSFYEKRHALLLFVVSFFTGSCFWSEPEVIIDSSRYFILFKTVGQGDFCLDRPAACAFFVWSGI
jgi:hypothetical protein